MNVILQLIFFNFTDCVHRVVSLFQGDQTITYLFFLFLLHCALFYLICSFSIYLCDLLKECDFRNLISTFALQPLSATILEVSQSPALSFLSSISSIRSAFISTSWTHQGIRLVFTKFFSHVARLQGN
jgi:hypothetical protein